MRPGIRDGLPEVPVREREGLAVAFAQGRQRALDAAEADHRVEVGALRAGHRADGAAVAVAADGADALREALDHGLADAEAPDEVMSVIVHGDHHPFIVLVRLSAIAFASPSLGFRIVPRPAR